MTINELAQELGVGKSTINRRIKELGIKGQLEFDRGAYQLTDEQADTIRRTIKSGAPHGTNDTPRHDIPHQNRAKDPGENTGTDPGTIAALLKQLEEKDRQINKLQDLLEQQHDLLSQEQKLHLLAEQKILALEEKQKEAETKQEETKKQGILARLFGRKENKTGSQADGAQESGTAPGADTSES